MFTYHSLLIEQIATPKRSNKSVATSQSITSTSSLVGLIDKNIYPLPRFQTFSEKLKAALLASLHKTSFNYVPRELSDFY
jgi:hypothetical protein